MKRIIVLIPIILIALLLLPFLMPTQLLYLQLWIGVPNKTIFCIMYYTIWVWFVTILILTQNKFKDIVIIPIILSLIGFFVSSIFTFSSYRELKPLSNASIYYLAYHDKNIPPRGEQIRIAKKLIDEKKYTESLEHIIIEIDFWTFESADEIKSVLSQLELKNMISDEFMFLKNRYKDLIEKRVEVHKITSKLDGMIVAYKREIGNIHLREQLYQRQIKEIYIAFSAYEKSEYNKAEEYCKKLLNELSGKEEFQNTKQLISALMSNVLNARKLYSQALSEFKKANPLWQKEIENARWAAFLAGQRYPAVPKY